MKWIYSGWLISMGVLSTPLAATDLSFQPNEVEMLRMPAYCQVKWRSPPSSPEWKGWRDRIGSNYLDIHHYCAGLNYVNRYWAAKNKKDRSYYLENAMNNFDYMVRAEKPDFALRSELYSSRGEVFKLQGRTGEAERDFRHAIELDPKLTRPYLQLIDLYEGRKQRKQALEVAKLGVRHNPDSKAMQRRYLELGGSQPFPEPFVPAITAPEPTPQVSAESAQAATSETADVEPVAPATPEPAAVTPPPTGSPTNPYCRFCPPE